MRKNLAKNLAKNLKKKLKNIPKKFQVALAGVALVSVLILKFALPSGWLTAAVINAPEQSITVSARMCKDWLDTKPEITTIAADCSSLNWSEITYVTGYPDCIVPNKEYFTQISLNDTFTDLLDTSGWIPGLTYNVAPDVPDTGILYYRVRGRDGTLPLDLAKQSSWSTVRTCGTAPGGGGGGGGDWGCEFFGTCPIDCGDGIFVAWDETCPVTPVETCEASGTCPIECPDGTTVAWDETCPLESEPTCEETGTCPIDCGDGIFVAWDETCPVEPVEPVDPPEEPEDEPTEVETPEDAHSSAPPETDVIRRDYDSDKDGCSDEYEIMNGTDPYEPFSMDPEINDCDWIEFFDGMDLLHEDLKVKGGDFKDYHFWVTGAVNFEAEHDVHFSLIDEDGFRIYINTLRLDEKSVYSFENQVEVKDGYYTLVATATGVDGRQLIGQDYVNIDPCLGIDIDLENFSGIWFENNRPIEYTGDILSVYGDKIFAYGKVTSGHILHAYWNSILLTSTVVADDTGFYVEPREKLDPAEIHTLVLVAEDPEHPELKTAPLIIKFRIRRSFSIWCLIPIILFLISSATFVYERKKRKTLMEEELELDKEVEELKVAELEVEGPVLKESVKFEGMTKEALASMLASKLSLGESLAKHILKLKKWIRISGTLALIFLMIILLCLWMRGFFGNFNWFPEDDGQKSSWSQENDVSASTCRERISYQRATGFRDSAEQMLSIFDLQCPHTEILGVGEVKYTNLEGESGKQEIETLTHFKVLTEPLDGIFDFEAVVEKADLVKALVLARCDGPLKKSDQQYFADVDPEQWYQDYIVSAKLAGWLDGKDKLPESDIVLEDSEFEDVPSDELLPDESMNDAELDGVLSDEARLDAEFGPEDEITRLEALKLIIRAFELEDNLAEYVVPLEGGLLYEDLSIEDENYNLVAFAEENYIVLIGDDRLFRGDEILTKLDMARWIYEAARYQFKH